MAAACPLFMRILGASVSVSNRAATIIRDIMSKGDLGIVEKGKDDLQTEADRAAQRCIIASLHRQFPAITIYGEEKLDPTDEIPEDYIITEICTDVLQQKCPPALVNAKDEEFVIWVDPLDGTAEYTQGLLDHVTVLIGLSHNGHAMGGVINQPYYNYQAGPGSPVGRCIWGAVGLNAFGFQRQLLPEGENIITTSRSHSNRAVTEAVEACEPSSVVRVGGAGHKILLLIEGKVHAYVFASKGCKKWDTCAPEAILCSVGGSLTDILGRDIPYHADVMFQNSFGVLATVSQHNWYVSKIPDHIQKLFESENESGRKD